MRSQGLRKFVPQPDRYSERYGHFTLTKRDVTILEFVHRYRYLEARHVRALVGGSGQQITRRLQGLFHHGYVGRYARRERMRLDLDPGAPLIAYGLELRGARTLERFRGAAAATTGTQPEPVGWKKEYSRRTEWFLEHHLMVSNFRGVLELALRAAPNIELESWSQSKDIWFRATIPGEGKRIARVAPDAYFVLRQGDQVRHFFLEADRSTEEHRRLIDKFMGYWRYLGDFQPKGGEPAHLRVVVLFLTRGETRLKNMMRTLEELAKPAHVTRGGKGAFWFGLERDFRVEAPIDVQMRVWRNTRGREFSLAG